MTEHRDQTQTMEGASDELSRMFSRLSEFLGDKDMADLLEMYSRVRVYSYMPFHRPGVKMTRSEIEAQTVEVLKETIRLLKVELRKPEYASIVNLPAGVVYSDKGLSQLYMQAENAAMRAAFIKLGYDVSEEPEEEPRSPRDIAIEAGALMTVGDVLSIPSDLDVLKRFSIAKLRQLTGVDPAADFSMDGQLRPELADRLQEIESVQEAFLMYLFTATEKIIKGDMANSNDFSMKIYGKAMLRDMGIDPRPTAKKRDHSKPREERIKDDRTRAIIDLLRPLLSLVGPDLNGKYRSVLSIEEYDRDTDVLILRSPFLFSVFRGLQYKADAERRPQYFQILHTDTVKKPRPAAEVASRLAAHIARKGSKVTGEIKCSTIMSECPELMRKLQRIKQAGAEGKLKNWKANYTEEMKRAFKGAFDILFNHSELLNKYKAVPNPADRSKTLPIIGPVNKAGEIELPTYRTYKSLKYVINCKPVKTKDAKQDAEQATEQV